MILVTNDDGIDSPALLPLLRALAELGPVRAVVPRSERSWISKAISRWTDVRVERMKLEGFEVVAVDGFPADCTNLGVHTLFDAPPELVVSGINLGLNTGLGWFLSSGTVGAAAEARIARLPAVAFSVGVPRDDRSWKADPARLHCADTWRRAAALCADIVRAVREIGFPPDCDLLNVNFPLGAGPETHRVVTRVASLGYAALFAHKGDDVFAHASNGELIGSDRHPESDVGALDRGWVSITPVRLASSAELSALVRTRLEQPRS